MVDRPEGVLLGRSAVSRGRKSLAIGSVGAGSLFKRSILWQHSRNDERLGTAK